MDGYKGEKTSYREGKVDIVGYVDLALIATRKSAQNPLYPVSYDQTLFGISEHELVLRKNSTRKNDHKTRVISSMMGEGNDIRENMPREDYGGYLRSFMMKNFSFVGVSVQSCPSDPAKVKQGFNIAVNGKVNIRNPDRRHYAPGTRLRVKYPDPNMSNSRVDGTTRDGSPSAKYLCTVEEDTPQVRANSIVGDLGLLARDHDGYKRMIQMSDKERMDKGLFAMKAVHDSSLMDGLMMILVLQNTGLLSFNTPSVIQEANPYDDEGKPILSNGGLDKCKTPEEWVIRMSQLLGIMSPDVGRSVPSDERASFESLRYAITSMQNTDGFYRNFDFGRKTRVGSSFPTRDTTGAVDMNSPGGKMLDLQLNHRRKAVSGLLQEVEAQNSQIVGVVTNCEPGKNLMEILVKPGGWQ